MLLAGGVLIALAALVAGASGFGLGLLATPLLLIAGFSLPFVVTVNLLVSLATRLVVVYRFRRDVSWRRAFTLVAASVPGLYLGAETLGAVDHQQITIGAGAVVMASAVALAVRRAAAPPRAHAATTVGAGFLGGFLGTTASLNGVPPVLLLTHERLRAPAFFADLAVYAVASAALGVGLLAATGNGSGEALYPAFLLWLPGALVANAAGAAVGVRLPANAFRLLVLTVVFVAGAITVVTAFT